MSLRAASPFCHCEERSDVAISLQRRPSKHHKNRTPKPAHLPAKTTDRAAKTLPPAPFSPHYRPNALPELAEMRGNEQEIDLLPRNDRPGTPAEC